MTVKELITALEKMPEDKIVVLTEPDGICQAYHVTKQPKDY